MFDILTEKLSAVFENLTNRGRLSELDVDEALKKVRLALLEADVNFKVARDFIGSVRDRAVGQDVLESLTPGQQVVKIVREQLTAMLTGKNHKLMVSTKGPTIVMLVGLQGSGKTTTASKLASQLRSGGKQPLLIAADLRRPAGIQQLETLGKQMGIPVFSSSTPSTVPDVVRAGVNHAKSENIDWVIADTGGRLHVDEDMMAELSEVQLLVSPHEILLVLDAMTGQDAVRTAEEFQKWVSLTGLILTKLDGDARGGAALSVTRVTGVPIKYIGLGERTDALEPFHPDRLASRILGMGDVLTLIEKTENMIDQERAKDIELKLRKATFDLNDFLEQIQGVKRMGSIGQFMEMIPGFSQVRKRMPTDAFDDKEIEKIEAIIYSMTPRERSHPDIINGSRRRRIAFGSGTKPQDINQLINQFSRTQKLMRQFANRRGPGGLPGLPRIT